MSDKTKGVIARTIAHSFLVLLALGLIGIYIYGWIVSTKDVAIVTGVVVGVVLVGFGVAWVSDNYEKGQEKALARGGIKK